MSNLDFIWEIILDKLKLCTLDTKIDNKNEGVIGTGEFINCGSKVIK